MEKFRRFRIALLLIIPLLVTAVWMWHRESTGSALAEEFIQEFLHDSNFKSPEQLWSDSVAAVARRRGMNKPDIETQLRSFASGGLVGQSRQERQRILAEIIQRRWYSASRCASETAGKHPSFGSLYLAGTLAYVMDDGAEARVALSAALEHPDGVPSLRAAAQIRLGQLELIAKQPERANSLMEAALRNLESTDTPADTTLAAGLNLASALANVTDRLDELEKVNQRLLPLLERLHGSEAGELVRPLTALGRVALSRNRLDDAERHLQRAAGIAAKTGVNDDILAGVLWSSLGEVLRCRGRLQEAETQTLKGLRLIERSPVAGTITEAHCLQTLGGVLGSLHRPAEALPRYERCIEIWEHKGNTQNPQFASVLSELGSTYQDLRRLAEAESAARRAVDLLEPKGLIDTPAFCKVAVNLGIILLNTDRPEQAERYLRRACSVALENIETVTPHEVAIYQNWLAQSYTRQGLIDKAEKQFRDLINFCEKHFPPNSTHLAEAHLASARLLLDTRRMPEAETSFGRALAICEKLQPSDDGLLIRVLNGLGVCLRQQNRSAEALRQLDRALNLSRKLYGPQHVNTAGVLANYSSALIDAGQPGQAVKLLTEALAVQQNDPVTNRVDFAPTLVNLARAFFQLGQTEEAERSLVSALRAFITHRKKTGERLPEEQVILGELRDFYKVLQLPQTEIEQKLRAASN